MKAFISYRFTGEKIEDIKALIDPVQTSLKDKGIDAYCNFSDDDLEERSKNFQPQDYVFDAFKIIDGTDLLFVILNSESKSEGMILEIGYCIAKKIPVVVAVRDDIKNTYLPGMANSVIKWGEVSDLVEKISEFDFDLIKNGRSS